MTDLNDSAKQLSSSITRPPDSIPAELQSFDQIYTYLTSPNALQPPFPVLPSATSKPKYPFLTHIISLHQLHPVLESVLHILNSDLYSAHFLLRHMQGPPAWEAMYLHGILHRIEGDYRNAEAWYADVSGSDVFQAVWSDRAPGEDENGSPDHNGGTGLIRSKAFIGQLEQLRKSGLGDLLQLEESSWREIEKFVEFCKNKFGTGKVDDATHVWVQPTDKHKKLASEMVVGGEGWREF